MEHLFGTEDNHSPPRISKNHFILLLGLSLILHLACSLALLMPRQGRLSLPAVATLDLTMTEPAPTPPPVPTESEPEMHDPEALPVREQLPEPPPPTEFSRLQQDVREAVEAAESRPEAMAERSLSLGITNGYFSSFADGQSLHQAVREYYFTILKAINEKWWVATGGKSGARSKAILNIFVARDGKVIRIELVKSSGNKSYDRSLVRAIEAASPLPPLPTEFPFRVFDAPLLFNPPFFLLGD